MDSYDFDDRFGKLVSGNLEGLDTLELRRLATYVGMNEHTAATIDRLDEEQYAVLQRSLVGLAAAGAAETADDEERGRYALRLLVNVGQRSERHKGALPVDVLPQLRDLLLARRHLPECAAVLTMAGPRLATTAALDHNLDTIVRGDGGASVAECGELPSSAFTALLHVVEALCDGLVMGGRRDDEFRMHSNNVQMLVDIVRRAHFDYSDEAREGPSTATAPSAARFLPAYPKQLPLLLSSIASLATRLDLIGEVLDRANNAPLIDVVVEMLDVVLHAEADLERAERPGDRPQRAPAFNSPRVLASPTLSRMAAAFAADESRQRARERAGVMKCAAVRAVGNLVADCPSTSVRAGQSGAVALCLAAARRREHDDAFVTQWSIAALRYLCLGCPPNQELLAAIDTLNILNAVDIPLPAGYEPEHANLFVRYTLPYPTDAPQTGKTKYASGSRSPNWNKTIVLQIGSKKIGDSKLLRVLKRLPLKLEATGGVVSARVRVREPLGDTKGAAPTINWLVIDV